MRAPVGDEEDHLRLAVVGGDRDVFACEVLALQDGRGASRVVVGLTVREGRQCVAGHRDRRGLAVLRRILLVVAPEHREGDRGDGRDGDHADHDRHGRQLLLRRRPLR